MDIITCVICKYLLKVKMIIFGNFFDILFDIFKNPPLPLKLEV